VTRAQQQITALVFGVVFIVTLIILSIALPNPTPFQYTIFRIILALATAGVSAMVPGLLHVEVSSWLRSSGALAVFVIVYFYNPASLVYPHDVDQSHVPVEHLSSSVQVTPQKELVDRQSSSAAGKTTAADVPSGIGNPKGNLGSDVGQPGSHENPATIDLPELMKLYVGNTQIQGNRLAAAYFGKWITVSGRLDDVVSPGSQVALVTLLPEPSRPATVYLEFRQQIDDLALKRRGDLIVVVGQVKTIGERTFTLENCELLKKHSQ